MYLTFLPKCSGFIFCEFFSNLGPTGCRRGRTPERPLRQPSKVWLIKPDLFCFRRLAPIHVPLSETWVNPLPGASHMLQRVQSVGNLGLHRFPTAAERRAQLRCS